MWLYVYGRDQFSVRVGISGTRPLIYAVYATPVGMNLPDTKGQRYRTVTEEQYEWLRNHIGCDVSYLADGWPDTCGLECRTHREFYTAFSSNDPSMADIWDDRQI